MEADLALPGAPAAVVERAVQLFRHVDVIVANHARSSGRQTLSNVTVEELDLSWAVNARASVLLTRAFAAQHDDRRGGGRVVLFTSGQHLAPMTQEVPYTISKGAIHQMTLTLADALVDRGITVNTINPGPTDTGWASPELSIRSDTHFRRVAGVLPMTSLGWCLGWFPTTAPGSPGQVRILKAGFAVGRWSTVTEPHRDRAEVTRREEESHDERPEVRRHPSEARMTTQSRC